jgi:hypothetical protein
MFDFKTGVMTERANLAVLNPAITEPGKPITEGLISDVKIGEVRVIYPSLNAINSGRVTHNYTLYPAESLIGKNKPGEPTGYASFALPYGKPILREHRAQDSGGLFGDGTLADTPMGRVVFAGFRRRRKEETQTPAKKGYPGTVEGDGTLIAVPAISDTNAIHAILGGALQTVSIGSRVDKIIESISGEDIIALYKAGKDLPPYEKGQEYKGQLSYWRMGEIKGKEISFVNMPSDDRAGVSNPDIGLEGIRVLMGEKKPGTKEFHFYDSLTREKVDFSIDEGVWDESYLLQDSLAVGQNIFVVPGAVRESVSDDSIDLDKLISEALMADKQNKECLTNSKVLLEVLSKIGDDQTKLDELRAKLNEAASESIEASNLKEIVETLAEGNPLEGLEPSNEELFHEAQDLAMKVFTDVNQESMAMAVAYFIENKGSFTKIVDVNAPITIGTLYNTGNEKLDAIELPITA